MLGRRVKVGGRDWLPAVAMSTGIGLFLCLTSPSGGRLRTPIWSWCWAGLVTLGIVLSALAVVFGPRKRGRSPALGGATGISWGFVAVTKELSSYLGDRISAIVSTWWPYVSHRRRRGDYAAGRRPAGGIPARVHDH